MPVKNLEVAHVCQVVLVVVGGLGVAAEMDHYLIAGVRTSDIQTPALELSLSFLLTNLSYLAFPARRRLDLVVAASLICMLFSLAEGLFGGTFNGAILASGLAGAWAAYAGTFIEPLRAAGRSAPSGAFSLSPRNDHRRRAGDARSLIGTRAARRAAEG